MNKDAYCTVPSGKNCIKVMRFGDLLKGSRKYYFVYETKDAAAFRNMIVNGGCLSSHLYHYGFDRVSKRLTAINKRSGRMIRCLKIKNTAALLAAIP